jgi:hypothetical protein
MNQSDATKTVGVADSIARKTWNKTTLPEKVADYLFGYAGQLSIIPRTRSPDAIGRLALSAKGIARAHNVDISNREIQLLTREYARITYFFEGSLWRDERYMRGMLRTFGADAKNITIAEIEELGANSFRKDMLDRLAEDNIARYLKDKYYETRYIDAYIYAEEMHSSSDDRPLIDAAVARVKKFMPHSSDNAKRYGSEMLDFAEFLVNRMPQEKRSDYAGGIKELRRQLQAK